jgi:curved DNA-binding protein CbpA
MSSPRKAEETFYDILKIDTRATISEIVAAYHSARNAFSKDSVATYSLFSTEETGAILDRLEQAYLTLSNVDKKREYDRQLQQKLKSEESLIMAAEQESQSAQPPDPAVAAAESVFATDLGEDLLGAPRVNDSKVLHTDLPTEFPTEGSAGTDAGPAPTEAAAPAVATEWTDGPLSGQHLKEIREKRALSVDDVSRITKIPSKFIRAIESDDPRQLPARVYLQGFVKNLATLYRLDTKTAAKAYLQHVDSLGTSPQE